MKIICKRCHRLRKHHARGLCESCYRILRKNPNAQLNGGTVVCLRCHRPRKVYCHGLCRSCYNSLSRDAFVDYHKRNRKNSVGGYHRLHL